MNIAPRMRDYILQIIYIFTMMIQKQEIANMV